MFFLRIYYVVFFLILHRSPRSTLFPYTTLFRSLCTPLYVTELASDLLINMVVILGEDRRYALPTMERIAYNRSEEHTSELQSHSDLVCRLLLEKKKI